MKSKVRLMSLVVSFTLILLAIGATLVVLGLFNEALHWDIFGPRLEAFLYGLFGSCMALAAFGTLPFSLRGATRRAALRLKLGVISDIHVPSRERSNWFRAASRRKWAVTLFKKHLRRFLASEKLSD